MMTTKCTGCGAYLKIDENNEYYVCDYCGNKYKNEMSFSAPISSQNDVKPNYKSVSTFEFNGEVLKNNEKLIITLVLCFFFGVWGVHKFYEKKIGMGILYLFTFGLFGIGWFVDMITLIIRLIQNLSNNRE